MSTNRSLLLLLIVWMSLTGCGRSDACAPCVCSRPPVHLMQLPIAQPETDMIERMEALLNPSAATQPTASD